MTQLQLKACSAQHQQAGGYKGLCKSCRFCTQQQTILMSDAQNILELVGAIAVCTSILSMVDILHSFSCLQTLFVTLYNTTKNVTGCLLWFFQVPPPKLPQLSS